MTVKNGQTPARFLERFLAYFIDLLPFFLGFQISSFLIILTFRVPMPRPFAIFWAAVWLSGFISYQTRLNSEGRASLGKRLLGLRVVDDEGNPLSRKKALVRAAGYLISGAFFNLGFLWALFHPRKKAWHDLLAKSQVVEIGEKTKMARMGLKFCAAGLMASVIFYLLWINVLLPMSYQREMVKNAQIALNALGSMEDVYKNRYGTYTDQLTDLAGLTEDPLQFAQDVMNVFEPGIEIKADKKSFTITASARDDRKTMVSLTGPGGEATVLRKPQAPPAGEPAAPSKTASASKPLPAAPETPKAATAKLSEESREIVDAIVEEIQKRPDRLSRFFKEPSPRKAAEKIWETALQADSEGTARVGGVEIAGDEYFEALRKEKSAVISEFEKAFKSR